MKGSYAQINSAVFLDIETFEYNCN